MTFALLMLTFISLISAYISWHPSSVEKMIEKIKQPTINEEVTTNIENTLYIDYDIEDGDDIYFEIIPTEQVNQNRIETINVITDINGHDFVVDKYAMRKESIFIPKGKSLNDCLQEFHNL